MREQEKHKNLEISDLRIGDILLHRSKQKLHRVIISHTTKSPYTHASLYIGEGEILEAKPFKKVGSSNLNDKLDANTIIGVLRSQMTFQEDRIDILNNFIADIISNSSQYAWQKAFQYAIKTQKKSFRTLEETVNNYGKSKTAEELAASNFFCSSLVVACYIAVGIISESAQCAYPHEDFSPADIYSDPTFGWFLGYLAKDCNSIPKDDPLKYITEW